MCYSKCENVIQTSRKNYSDVENYIKNIKEIKTKEYSDVEYREIVPEKRDFSLVAKIILGVSASLFVITFVSIFCSLFASVRYNNSNMYDTTNLSTEQENEEEISIDNDTNVVLDEFFAYFENSNLSLISKVLFSKDTEYSFVESYVLDYGLVKNEVINKYVSRGIIPFLNDKDVSQDFSLGVVSDDYYVDKYKTNVFAS